MIKINRLFLNAPAALLLSFIFIAPGALAEEVEITAYYPSPYGNYKELSSTDKTVLATSTGNVGIGTTTPASKLDVSGNVRIASSDGDTILMGEFGGGAGAFDVGFDGDAGATQNLRFWGGDGTNGWVMDNFNVRSAASSFSGNILVEGQYNSTKHTLGDTEPVEVNWNNGNVQYVTIPGNRTVTLSNPVDGGRYLLTIRQGGAGSWTITWPGNVSWPGGAAAPTLSGAGKVDIITLTYNGTTDKYYCGYLLNYS